MREVIFETKRLTVRKVTAADVDAFHEMWGDAQTMRYVDNGETRKTKEATSEVIERMLRYYEEKPGMGWWAVTEKGTGSVVGTVCIQEMSDGVEVEVGYKMCKPVWGRGYATEATRGALKYGFGTLEFDRIVAVINPENGASKRVLEKAGLKSIGTSQYRGKHVEKFELLRGNFNLRELYA